MAGPYLFRGSHEFPHTANEILEIIKNGKHTENGELTIGYSKLSNAQNYKKLKKINMLHAL